MPRPTKKELQANVEAIEQLPTRRDIARRCGVSLRTIDRWVVERRIPHIRFGKRCVRFRWDAVEKAIDRLVVEEVR
jgi:excisionase family DNA binding protein